MSDTTHRCAAVTHAGTPCRNFAVVGSKYCHLHSAQETPRNGAASVTDIASVAGAEELPETPGAPDAGVSQEAAERSPDKAGPDKVSPEMQMLAREIDGLIRELRAYGPALSLDNLTPAQFMHVFNRTIGKRLPSTQAELLEDVERNLEGSSFIDFADPEVLRGTALLTYYSLQAQAEPYKEPVLARLRSLPGFSILRGLTDNVKGTTLDDLTDPDTWKGMWTVASYAALLKLQELLQEEDEQE